MNRDGNGKFFLFQGHPSDKLMIYTRFHPDLMQTVDDFSFEDESNTPNLCFRHLINPLYPDLILGVAHLPSKLYRNSEEQALLSTRFRTTIQGIEEQLGHSRTVLLGDFNMDPFEIGMVNSESFHAVMDRNTAIEESRIVEYEQRYFFYNPMWSMMGDLSDGPPGTYYKRRGSISYFWHTFDQVLLRPSLIECFDTHSLAIITEVREESLLRDNGRPDTDKASDHLPIFFRLELPLEDET